MKKLVVISKLYIVYMVQAKQQQWMCVVQPKMENIAQDVACGGKHPAGQRTERLGCVNVPSKATQQ